MKSIELAFFLNNQTIFAAIPGKDTKQDILQNKTSSSLRAQG